MTFEEFCKIIRESVAKGEIVITTELNDLDLAVQYSIGQEMAEKGVEEMDTDPEQIYYLIGKHCGEATRDRIFKE